MIHPLDVLKCNCARCDIELIGSRMRGMALPYTCDGQPFVAGFINQRPYCEPCLERMNAEDNEEIRKACQQFVMPQTNRDLRADDPAGHYAVQVRGDVTSG